MALSRRTFIGSVVGGSLAAAALPELVTPESAQAATYVKTLTGASLPPAWRWSVVGTDLGIPYVLENGSIGYLFGDTFSTPFPEGGGGWRSPVMLRSNIHPGASGGVEFDSAAKVAGDGYAPEIMHNGHNGPDHEGRFEVTVIPNDGISFPETGRQIVSYMSIEQWYDPNNPGPNNAAWRSRYAGLAYSDNGNDFYRTDLKWWNNGNNSDPFQMWTMQRWDDHVYIFSVPAGRQTGGAMMLQRVHWERMFYPADYEGWGWDNNAQNWAWGRPPTPILFGQFGEPSVRRLDDGTWVMAYLVVDGIPRIVTRTASGPDEVWTSEKIQVTALEESFLYGGFIHPWSTTDTNDLHLMISTWKRDQNGNSTAYHMSQFRGTA
jgi:hypothetical protein